MNLDDPKLTAFALDELDESEKSAIAKEIAASPGAQHEVDEIRGIAGALSNEFAAEMEGRAPARRAAHGHERRSLSDMHGDRWFWSIARPLAIAATLAVLGLVTAILLGGRYSKFAGPRSSTAEIELVDSAPRAKTNPDDAVANPLQIELIERVDHAVVGEVVGENEASTAVVRLIDDIREPARVAKLKKCLTTRNLRKMPSEGTNVRTYRIIFLDRAEHTVACADFSCSNGNGAVLRLVVRNGNLPLPGDWQPQIDYSDYAIPFPEWKEAISRCPGTG
jgi:hypothetical protein